MAYIIKCLSTFFAVFIAAAAVVFTALSHTLGNPLSKTAAENDCGCSCQCNGQFRNEDGRYACCDNTCCETCKCSDNGVCRCGDVCTISSCSCNADGKCSCKTDGKPDGTHVCQCGGCTEFHGK